jgi:large subunit ribosomal protein L21
MWEQMVKRWFRLVFWWMPGSDQTRVRNEEAATPSNGEQRGDPAPRPPTARVADDLTVIKGIGPAVQKKLRELDIITFSDLAEADADALTEKLKGSQPISITRVRAWTEDARARSGV